MWPDGRKEEEIGEKKSVFQERYINKCQKWSNFEKKTSKSVSNRIEGENERNK